MSERTNRQTPRPSNPSSNILLLQSLEQSSISPERPDQAATTRRTMTGSPPHTRAPHRSSPQPQLESAPVTRTTTPTSPPHRRANQANPTRPLTGSIMRGNTLRASSEKDNSEWKVAARNIPTHWDTGKVYELLKQYGKITKIDIIDSRENEPAIAWVTFSPRPRNTNWTYAPMIIGNKHVRFSVPPSKERVHKSPKDPSREFAEEIKVSCSELGFGVMESKDRMLILRQINSTTFSPMEVKVNLHRKNLDIDFAMARTGLSTPTNPSHLRLFKMQLSLAEIESIVQMKQDSSGRFAWVISIAHPPILFRKSDSVEKTHETGSKLWNEWQAWNRQTEIASDPTAAKHATIQLQRANSCIDIGRWRSYLLLFDQAAAKSPAFAELNDALSDHGVQIVMDKSVAFGFSKSKVLWDWLDNSSAVLKRGDNSSVLELHQLAEETIRLPFDLRYQLEVCVSLGLLHECNITKEFLGKIIAMDQQRALKLLEKVADEKQRFFNPDDIFKSLMHKLGLHQKRIPSYCAMVRAATVTPTTIYFMTPVLETSNRVIRKFQHYEDRFLRVKFTDEKYKGRVQSRSDDTMNEVYTRIKRTMKNGIRVGDRHYEFLAFGNSQFREHGAWFFSSTSDLTAQQIREKMGNFSDIKIVAKYCSRIGQCFSTTRATNWSFEETKIPDIERGGFCFTDGVGKMSQFLAQMIAQELGYPNSPSDYPSAFQFRREGCKGILVVDPSLTKQAIQIRPSQEKFSGFSHRGLEIVRVARFSTAYLNIQLVLVLSALGVEDGVFVRMMRTALRDLEEAMNSETKALELLQKNIDYNHMTIQLSSMILDGFMETKDPFTISCLRLWRSWTVKYLKEKARISVEQGAFVLGCVDETATLKGHFNRAADDQTDNQDISTLPEVFLQIDPTGEGKWQITEGICVLARNPSLHPGDVRVVHAVDNPALRHIRNCVVFPQTGDRDIPNMCSGGDLDGDDYLVVWDKDLIPKEWNHPPMDYTGPPAVVSEGDVTVDDMTSFFVQHMKNDNLGPIAVAHRYWADFLDDGVKDPTCLKLAELHSMAVDYVKTGCPAKMPKSLHVKTRPHWAESKGRQYTSKKVIGQLYDEVKGIDFVPAWNLPFDQRILDAYTLNDQLLNDATEIKQQYDTAMRRIMAKFSIENEFEIWTTFVRKRSEEMSDYKIAETVGEASSALKDTFQKLCHLKAGTTHQERDWSKLAPFVTAMYTITANEVVAAMADRNKTRLKDERWMPVNAPSFENMPLMSFPWLFPAELGRIANKRDHGRNDLAHKFVASRVKQQKNPLAHLLDDADFLPELKEVEFPREAFETSSWSENRDAPLPVMTSAGAVPEAMVLEARPSREEITLPVLEDIMPTPDTIYTTPEEEKAKEMTLPVFDDLVPAIETISNTPEATEAKEMALPLFEDTIPTLEVLPNMAENISMNLPQARPYNSTETSNISRGNSNIVEESDEEDEGEIEYVTITPRPSALIGFERAFGY